MAPLAALVFGLFALAAATVVAVLTANVEPQPEYPRVMTVAFRALGVVIAGGGVAVGAVWLGYAALAHLGVG